VSRRVVCTPLSHWFGQIRKGGEIAFEQVYIEVEKKKKGKTKNNEMGYHRVRLAHAVWSDVQADTLDQHNKVAVELFPRYIPLVFWGDDRKIFQKPQ